MIVSDFIYLESNELSKREWKVLFSKLTYTDADQCLHQPWNFIPHKDQVRIPRGAWNLLPGHVEYNDRRVCPKYPKLKYTLELDAELPDGRRFERQKEAVEAMLFNEQGLVVRPPGTGKSQIILAFAAICETNVLILVHTEDILQQWIEYASIALPGTEIGVIRGKTINVKQVTISTVQTFKRCIKTEPRFKSMFGAVILDEAHHASAPTFEGILNKMKSKYRFGVTASPTRADGKHPYMRTVIGPVIHRMKFKSPVKVEVQPIKTGFYYGYRGRWDWGNLLRALISDDKRNTAIAVAAEEEIKNGNTVLILSRRIEHLQRIAALMPSFQTDGALLVGEWEDEHGVRHKLSSETRKKIMHDFRSGVLRCVLATQLADEALDVPILNRVFLIHPGKHEGRIIQQIGRALREHPMKSDARIYDVVDRRITVLYNQWRQRARTYKKLGIPIRGGSLWNVKSVKKMK